MAASPGSGSTSSRPLKGRSKPHIGMERRDGSFFGRRKGKTLRSLQREALDNLPAFAARRPVRAGAPAPVGVVRCTGRRDAAGDRLRRRRAPAASGANLSPVGVHRHRAVRERARQGGRRPAARADGKRPALRPRCRAAARLAAGANRSPASTFSTPIRGRRRATGSAASSMPGTWIESRDASCPAARSASPATSMPM